MSAYFTSMKAPKNYPFLFFLSIFHLTMGLCGMFKKLGRKRDEQGKLEISVHSSVVTMTDQPLQDRQEYAINEDITPVSHLSPIDVQGMRDGQGKLERSDHSSVVTKSQHQQLQDIKKSVINEDITPHVSPIDIEVSNVVENSSLTMTDRPLQDRKESSINEDITPVSHLSPINVEGIRDEQGKLERSDYSSVVTKSQHQQLQDIKKSVINEDITPVSQVSAIDIEVSNEVENPGADGGVLQDVGGGELQDWRSLPDLVLLFILKHFTSFGDFFAFSRVCREWRHVSEFAKREYMETQPPLLFENMDGFYSWKEEKLYTKKIKSVFKKESIIDFSHGYLIFLCYASYNQVPYKRFSTLVNYKRFFSLVNPITGVEALPEFPIVPNYIGSRYVRVKRASLMSPPTSPDCMLMFSNDTFILLCHSGDREWTVYPRDDKDGKILCETFFNGRVYALNDKGHLLILDPAFPHHHRKRTVLEVKNNPFSHRNMTWLAACGGDLFAIELKKKIREVKFVVRSFDPMKFMWMKRKNWGNSHVLFLNSRRSAFWDNAVSWGGRGNCIYFHGVLHYRGLFVFDMEDGKIEDLPLSLRYYDRSFWVFPGLCC